MNFFRDVVSHLLKNAFEGHTKFSVADNTAVGANPIRSISLDAAPADGNTIISLSWDGGEKLFEKTLSEQEAPHQFELISSDLAEVASLTKQGQYDAAKDLMKKLGQKYAENTGELVQTNLPKLHNTQASHKHEDMTMPCDKCDQTMCPGCGYTTDSGQTYHSKCRKDVDSSLDDKIWRTAKITMQNLWFSTTDELLDYQQKQKGAAKPGDQDHIPLWDKNKKSTSPTDELAPASLSYEDKEDQKAQEHDDMQKHIDEKIKTELESALQQKAASVFGPDQVELVQILKKNGRNWDEIKKILVKDFGFDKDSVNIFVDEQRQGSDPTGIEVEPVEEDPKDMKEESPLTPPEDLVSPETHDKLLQDHEDKKKDKSPVEEVEPPIKEESAQGENCLGCGHMKPIKGECPSCKRCDCEPGYKDSTFTPEDIMAISELDEIARADNDEIHKVAAPTDLNPLQEPITEEPTTPQQDIVPMGKKPLDHEAPQKGDRVFVASDMADEKAGFEGIFVSSYKSQGRDQFIVETDEGDLLDVDAHRVNKISEGDSAQTTEPSMEPIIEAPKEQEIPVTPKMSDFHAEQDEALAIKKEAELLLKVATETEADEQTTFWDERSYDEKHPMMAKYPEVVDKIVAAIEKHGDNWYKVEQTIFDASPFYMMNLSSAVGSREGAELIREVYEWMQDQKDMGEDKVFVPMKQEASLKKEAGVTWHDVGLQDPPESAVRVQHQSGLTGTIVGFDDKFADVKFDQKIKNDEATCQQLGLSWIQLERGDHPKGVYAIYAEGFGARHSAPVWTLLDASGQPIYPKGYQPPKPMEHDVIHETEPAIDTESAMVNWKCPKCGNAASASSVYDEKICMKDGCGANMQKQASASVVPTFDPMNGPSDEDVQQKAWEMYKLHWNALGSKEMDEVYKALGVKASDFEKGISQNKTSADPVDPAKTQFKDYKITPKYVPKEEAVPATPEIDAVLTKMANLETNLATLETARKQIEAKMKEELAKVDQSGNRVEMEAALQESIEKAAVLISAVNSKVVQWKDKLYTLQTEEVSYVPKLTPKEMLAKIYAKFDGAEKYVQDVLNGMLSQAKNVMENTLIRWPNKKSSLNKEATILDDMNHYNDELMAALKELSSPL